MSKQSLDLIQEKINELGDMSSDLDAIQEKINVLENISGDVYNMAQANWNACKNIKLRLNDIQASLSQIEDVLKNIDETLYRESLD